MNPDLIFLATSYTQRNNTRLDKYLDGYATIQFSPIGGLEAGYDEQFFALVGGPYFWPAHPGVRIRFRAAPGYRYWPHRHVGFRGSLIEHWRSEGLWLETPQAAPPSRNDKEWDDFFRELMALARRDDTWGRRRGINMLESLLLELAEARAAQQRANAPLHEPWLPTVLDALTANPAGENPPPDYEQIAHDVGLSATTLRRRFKRAMNTTPHTYAIRSRVDAARTLLLETDLPIKAIAARLGYENVYFFSRQFSQFVGVAPGVFRNSRLGK